MKTKLLAAIILSVSVFALTATPSYAYFEVLGFRIPTSISEIKEVIYGEKHSESTELTEGPKEIIPENNIEYDEDKGRTHESMVFTEESLNVYLSDLEGRSGYGYTLESAQVKLLNNAFEVEVYLNDGIAMKGFFKLNEDGNDIEIVSLENIGENNLSKMQLFALKVAINTAPGLARKYVPDEYVKRFSHVEVDPPVVRVWLVAE